MKVESKGRERSRKREREMEVGIMALGCNVMDVWYAGWRVPVLLSVCGVKEHTVGAHIQ